MATYWRIVGVLNAIASVILTFYSWTVLRVGFLFGILVLFVSINSSILPFTIANLCERTEYTEAAVGGMAKKLYTNRDFLNNEPVGGRSNIDIAAQSVSIGDSSWKCSCGRVNADYISTCTCGKSKRECVRKTTL